MAKEQAPSQTANAPAAQGESSSALPRLQWKLPAGWEEAPPGEMRVASFRVVGKEGKQADVGVVPLPGLMGGDLENVNRWRGSVGLPPVKEEELAKLAESVEVAGQPAQLFDQSGENPGSGEKTRILAAVLRREGVAWFFKMNGDEAVVAQQKPAFIEFLKSLSFAGAGAPADLPPSHPPVAGADTRMPSAAATAVTASAAAKPTWQVPANWQETPGGPFLVAKFVITGAEKAQANVNVSMSAGTGGGVAGNVNRWRGQLGLEQMPEAEVSKSLTSLDTTAGKAMLVDMTGTDAKSGQKARLVGAIVPQADQTWFFKLMGNEQVVGQEKEAFTKFVQTAKF
ncbi:MAG TPA: hypothetical protein VNT26_13435 [Candidatus Sulfotelmatobacter sp.]|nr:hypothetical protein [Candidatus Sulfotelmatobacter sp.]